MLSKEAFRKRIRPQNRKIKEKSKPYLVTRGHNKIIFSVIDHFKSGASVERTEIDRCDPKTNTPLCEVVVKNIFI